MEVLNEATEEHQQKSCSVLEGLDEHILKLEKISNDVVKVSSSTLDKIIYFI
jgi:hypothetical protein